MKEDNNRRITIVLPLDTIKMMSILAKREKRTVEQQASMIIMNFFKDYKHILEFENEKDFGFITEEKLREIIQKEENQTGYKYEDIEDYSFNDLFDFLLFVVFLLAFLR